MCLYVQVISPEKDWYSCKNSCKTIQYSDENRLLCTWYVRKVLRACAEGKYPPISDPATFYSLARTVLRGSNCALLREAAARLRGVLRIYE